MTTLFAQPYDGSATGFYFDCAEDYLTKAKALRNALGQRSLAKWRAAPLSRLS